MNFHTRLLITLSLVLPLQAHATGDFSTEATVRYVIDCMIENGGMTDENFYQCTCRHDALVSNINFSDYEEAVTYERNKAMPGEKGAAFRDIKRAESMYDKLLKAREVAAAGCPSVVRVNR